VSREIQNVVDVRMLMNFLFTAYETSFFFFQATAAIGTQCAIYLSALSTVNVSFYKSFRLRLPDIVRHQKWWLAHCDTVYAVQAVYSDDSIAQVVTLTKTSTT